MFIHTLTRSFTHSFAPALDSMASKNNSVSLNFSVGLSTGVLVGAGLGYFLFGGSESRAGNGGVRFDKNAITKLAKSYPKPVTKKPFSYGTAGFRMNESLLDSVCVRMGMLAVLRALKTGVPVGIMVTASHNGAQDNGLKLTDHDGGMLTASWESYATKLANAAEGDVFAVIVSILRDENMQFCSSSLQACGSPMIFLGRDTRTHSPRLAECCRIGGRVLGATVNDVGIVTTPPAAPCRVHAQPGPDGVPLEMGGRRRVLQKGGILLSLVDPLRGPVPPSRIARPARCRLRQRRGCSADRAADKEPERHP